MMNLVDCPDCGRINNAALEKCRECGKELPSASPSKVKCPYCADLISPEALKCKHCHEYLTNQSSSAVEMRTTVTRRERTNTARSLACFIDLFIYYCIIVIPALLVSGLNSFFWLILAPPIFCLCVFLIIKIESGTQSIGKRALNLHVVVLNANTHNGEKRFYGLFGESSRNKKLVFRTILKWVLPLASIFILHANGEVTRNPGYVIGLWFWVLVYFLINLLWNISSKHSQTIYDQITGTFVEREESMTL